MDLALNPYASGAGTQPPKPTGRANLLEAARIAFMRTGNGLSSKNLILVGLCGVGKTVLLNRVEDQAGEVGYFPSLIKASLGCSSHRCGEIAEKFKAPIRSVVQVYFSLIFKSMVYSPAHGDSGFTVPLFDVYLQRMMPVG